MDEQWGSTALHHPSVSTLELTSSVRVVEVVVVQVVRSRTFGDDFLVVKRSFAAPSHVHKTLGYRSERERERKGGGECFVKSRVFYSLLSLSHDFG